MSSRGVLGTLVLAFALAPRSIAATPEPADSDAIRLAVVIVVDGLGETELRQRAPLFDGGLGRLLRESTAYTNVRFPHLATETAPGHAGISTGQPPSRTGIIANTWRVRAEHTPSREVRSTDPPIEGQPHPGPGQLAVPTLGDRLVERRSSRVISLSGKARSAIFLAGRDRRHVAYWLDADKLRFVTSPAYDSNEPRTAALHRVIRQFNEQDTVAKLVTKEMPGGWTPLDPTAEPTKPGFSGVRSASELRAFQATETGLGFPHRLRTSTGDLDHFAVESSPLNDTFVSELARRLISDETLRLGRGDDPDLLLLSFSAHDLVSHGFGIESSEAVEVLRRLDREIGALLDLLVTTVGRAHLAVALTADHGFQPIPELSGGTRLYVQSTESTALPDAVSRLNGCLALELGLPPDTRVVTGLYGWNLYYDHEALASGRIKREVDGRSIRVTDVDVALPKAVRFALPREVRSTLLARQIDRWPTGRLEDAARLTFFAGRSGDALLLPYPRVVLTRDPARGSGHGNPHDPDAHVPLLLWGPGFAPGTRPEATTPYDVAPTMAALVGVDLGPTMGRDRSRLADAPPRVPAERR